MKTRRRTVLAFAAVMVAVLGEAVAAGLSVSGARSPRSPFTVQVLHADEMRPADCIKAPDCSPQPHDISKPARGFPDEMPLPADAKANLADVAPVVVLGVVQPVPTAGSPPRFGHTVTVDGIHTPIRVGSGAVRPNRGFDAVHTFSELVPFSRITSTHATGYATGGSGGSGCVVCRINDNLRRQHKIRDDLRRRRRMHLPRANSPNMYRQPGAEAWSN